MKKKIAILGSTGSIGKSLLEIIDKHQSNFEIVLLTANNDYKKLLLLAKKFKVKNLIINNFYSYKTLKLKTRKLNINVFNNFNDFDKILKNRLCNELNNWYRWSISNNKNYKIYKKIAIANKINYMWLEFNL